MSSWERRMGDGAVQAARGELERAIQAYDDAVKAASNGLERSRALAGRGAVRDRSGDPGGRDDLEEALRIAEISDPEELFLRQHDAGVARVVSGRPLDAVGLLETAWRAAPTFPQQLPSLEVLAQAYLDVDNTRGAESCYLQLLSACQQAQRPDIAVRAHNGRGEALRRMGRREEALGAFQKVVELMSPIKEPLPEQREQAGIALHNLGVLFLDDRPQVAAQVLDEAIKCFVDAYGASNHPHVARSKAFLGKLALDRGDADRAASLFDEAVRMVGPTDPVATQLVPMLRGA